jgi:hypothetical protein
MSVSKQRREDWQELAKSSNLTYKTGRVYGDYRGRSIILDKRYDPDLILLVLELIFGSDTGSGIGREQTRIRLSVNNKSNGRMTIKSRKSLKSASENPYRVTSRPSRFADHILSRRRISERIDYFFGYGVLETRIRLSIRRADILVLQNHMPSSPQYLYWWFELLSDMADELERVVI